MMTEKEKTIIQENDDATVLQREELEKRVEVIVDKLIEKRCEAFEKLEDDIFDEYHEVFEALAKGEE